MYKINLRDKAGLITSKEFNNLDKRVIMEEIKTIDGKTFEEVLEENKKLYPDALWDSMDPETFTEYVLYKHEYDRLFICDLTYKEWLIIKTMISLTHGEVYSIYIHEHYSIFED